MTSFFVPIVVEFLWQGSLLFLIALALVKSNRFRSSTMCCFVWLVTLVAVALLPIINISVRAIAAHYLQIDTEVATKEQNAEEADIPIHLAVKPDKESTGRWYDGSNRHLNIRFTRKSGGTIHDSGHYISPIEEVPVRTNRNGADLVEKGPIFFGITVDILFRIILLAWLGVVSIFVLRLVVSQIVVKKLVSKGRGIHDKEVLSNIDSVKSQIGTEKRISFCVSDNTLVPFSIGLLNPTIILPAYTLERGRREDLRSILIHEITHIERWDVPAKVFQYLVCAVYFFFPPVWLISRELNRLREEICDESVVRMTGHALDYARCLVTISKNLRNKPLRGIVGMELGEYKSRLLRRVAAIVEGTLRPASKLGLRKSFAVIMCAFLFVPLISIPGTVFRNDKSTEPPQLEIRKTAKWVPTNGPYGPRVKFLAAHPEEPLTIVVGTVGLFRSEDGGETWERPEITPSFLGRGLVSGIAFSQADPNIVYATINQSLIVSKDAGKTWKERFSCPNPNWRYNLKRYSEQLRGFLEADPFDSDRIYFINPHVSFKEHRPKMLSSTDGGRTFTNILLPMSNEGGRIISFSADCDLGGVLYLRYRGDQGERIAISRDHGLTWTSWPADIDPGENPVSFKLDPANEEDLYLLMYYGDTRTRSILRLNKKTSTWEIPAEGWKEAPEGWTIGSSPAYGISPLEGSEADFAAWGRLTVSPSDSDVAYYHPEWCFLRTANGGEIWQELGKGLPYYFGTVLTVHPKVPGTALVGSHLTEDYGRTWRDILPPEVKRMGMIIFHPHVSGRIFCGGKLTKVFYRSDDNGRTWRKLSDHWGWGMIFDKEDPSRYCLLQTERVYETFDGGNTWVEKAIPELNGHGEYARSAIEGDMALQMFPDGSVRLFVTGEEPRVFSLGEDGCKFRTACVSNVDGRRRLAVFYWDGPQVSVQWDLTGRTAAVSRPDGLHVSVDGGENWHTTPAERLPCDIESMEFDVNKDLLIFGTRDGRALGFDWTNGGSFKALGNRAHLFKITGIAPSPDGKSYWMATYWGGVWILRDEDGPSSKGRDGYSTAWSDMTHIATRDEIAVCLMGLVKRASECPPEIPDVMGEWAEQQDNSDN